MTLEELSALERIILAATPGPWVWKGQDEPADLWTADGKDAIVSVQTSNADIRFIQAMREHALSLVGAARNLAADLPGSWREDLESLQSCLERVSQVRGGPWDMEAVHKVLDAQGIPQTLQGGPLSTVERVEMLVRQKDEAKRWLQGSREEVDRLTQERWETASKQEETVRQARKERDTALQELSDTKAALKVLAEMFRDISLGCAR